MAPLPTPASFGQRRAPGSQRQPLVQERPGQLELAQGAEDPSLNRDILRLYAAGDRLGKRQDVIARAKAGDEFKAALAGELRRMEVEENNTTDAGVAAYRAFRQSKFDEIIKTTDASPDMKAVIAADLVKTSTKFSDFYAVMNIKAGRQLLLDTQDKSLNEQLGAVDDNPELVFEEIDEWTKRITQDSPGQDTNETRDQILQGNQKIVNTALNSYINRHDLKGAGNLIALLKSKGQGAFLDPKATAEVRKRILTRHLADTAFERKNTAWIEEYTRITGTAPTQEQILKHGPLSVSEPQTPFERVQGIDDAYFLKTGKRLTTGQWTRELLKKQEGAPLTTAEGFAKKEPVLELFAVNARKFAYGELTDDQDFRFRIAADDYVSTPIRVTDAITGKLKIVYRSLPEIVKRAFEERGLPVPGSARPPGQTIDPPGPTTGVPKLDGKPEFPAGQRPKGIFEKAESLAGPGPYVSPFIRSIPVFGKMMPGKENVREQKQLKILMKEMTTALQNSEKYPEGERKQVDAIVGLTVDFWDNPENFRDNIIGLDLSLRSLIGTTEILAENESLPADDRGFFRIRAGRLEEMRKRLGVPPTLGFDEVRRLRDSGQMKSGDPFLSGDEDGRLRYIK